MLRINVSIFIQNTQRKNEKQGQKQLIGYQRGTYTFPMGDDRILFVVLLQVGIGFFLIH